MKAKMLAYSSGALASALVYYAFSTYIQFYYVDILKLSPALVALAMSLFGLWNAINDPLIGYFSDRTHTRYGRRIPYIVVGMFPLAVVYVLIWSPPVAIVEGTFLFAYFLTLILLFDLFYTMVILNWTSLYPEMYTSLDERTRVSGYRQIFGIIGLIIGIALPPMIYGELGWQTMGISFALIMIVFLSLSVWGSQERYVPQKKEETLGIIAAYKLTLTNKSFLVYLIVNFLIQFTFISLTAAMPFYSKYVLGLTEMETSLMFLVIFLTAIPAIFVWQKVTTKIGARNAMFATISIFAVSVLPFFLANTYLTALITAAGAGIGLAGILLLVDILLADVIDEDTVHTGHRREGIYFGINGFMIRLGVSVQAIIMGFVLTFSGYDADLVSQPDQAILGIRVLVAVIPFISLILALVALRFYPLYGKKLEAVKKQLNL